ncbi:MAG: FAD-dependent oxidoreductase, partial [Clostridia bacterium]|nr:FAD-dependent oxidoreductase [Clostridia bacterium]
MSHYQLIVIGAGPGGYMAALHAAKNGLKTAVIENREAGGTCLNRGCVPTKTLLHSSEIYAAAKNGAHAGINAGEISADIPAI